MISRRRFVQKATHGLGLSLLLPSIESCKTTPAFNGTIKGPDAELGHRLLTMDFPAPGESITTNILIVGGGVAGLSAARFLKKHTDNFLLLELEENPGGNSMGGSNALSAFPWGAHYLPLPGNNDLELVSFLKETGVITGERNGLPIYNEYYLCHDPKERLFINHYWQDSIIPHEGVPKNDRDEIERFLSMMHAYKNLKGGDGKNAFAIPVEFSSQDSQITKLDQESADQFLTAHNFNSPFLRWYVNYCCADDYGSALQDTSAWAMIHYFASRRGIATNAQSDSVLTWPEGNYWLTKQLQKAVNHHILSRTLAYRVNIANDKLEVLIFDAAHNISKKIIAAKVILATPQFINQRLLPGISRNLDHKTFQYSPWMVANLTVNAHFTDGRGEPLCWDNVIYGSKSLGYVNAMHQQVGFQGSRKVITYYQPLTEKLPLTARMQAYAKTFADWRSGIINDLKIPHPKIEKQIEEMNVWIWGHGMVRPTPGFIWSPDRIQASVPVNNKIFFGHSDVGGISIFEEAFYQGHKSAKEALGI